MCCIAVAASQFVVKATGFVEYTVTINTGYKPLSSGHALMLNTSIDVIPEGYCTITPPSNQITLLAGASAISLTLNPNTDIICKFNVTADAAHKAAGEIAPFNVTARFTGPDNTDGVYFIAGTVENAGVPTTPSVPVYTGSVLGTPSSAVVETDPATFVTGE